MYRRIALTLWLTLAAACGAGEPMSLPKPACMWPLTISASQNKLDFKVYSLGAWGAELTAEIAAGPFYSPAEVAQAVEDAIAAATGTSDIEVTMSSTGHLQARNTVAGLNGLAFLGPDGSHWGSDPFAALGLGTAALTAYHPDSITGPAQIQHCWFSAKPVVDDTGDLDEYESAQTVSLSGVPKSLEYGAPDAPRLVRTVVLGFIPAYKMFIADEGASNANEAIQRFYRSGWTRFRWFDDATDLATGTDYALDVGSRKALPRDRLAPGTALYSVTLRMRPLVSP